MANKRFTFDELNLAGVFLIQTYRLGDERGFFAREFCASEFATRGLASNIEQINIADSRHKGTLRGMHYQLHPKAETKIVSVMRGAAWDVVLDLRRDSPTFGKYAAAELSADNGKIMYVPKGCAHGYMTLADDTLMCYYVDEFYAPDAERGIRWDDPAFAIRWPIEPQVISDRDRNHADFSLETHL